MGKKKQKAPRSIKVKYLILNIVSFSLFSIILDDESVGHVISGTIIWLLLFVLAVIILFVSISLSFYDGFNSNGTKAPKSIIASLMEHLKPDKSWVVTIIVAIDIILIIATLILSHGYSSIISRDFLIHFLNLVGFVSGAYILCCFIYRFIKPLYWLNDDYEKKYSVLVLLIFIVELITLSAIVLGFLDNQYYSQTSLYYYFSASAQAIAGFAGLSLAAYSFAQNRIDLLISRKSAKLDDKLRKELENRISSNFTEFLKFLSAFVCVSIILNILMLLRLKTMDSEELAVDILFFLSVTLNIAIIIGVVLLVILLADYTVADKIINRVWQEDIKNSENFKEPFIETGSVKEEKVIVESINDASSLDGIYSLIDKLYEDRGGSIKSRGNHIAELRWLVSSREIRDKELYHDLYEILGASVLGYDTDHEKIKNVKMKLEKLLDDHYA